VEQLCRSRDSLTYLPRENVEEKLRFAEEQFPDMSLSANKEQLAGSTYVSISDAVALQEYSYNQSSISLTVQNENGDESEIKIFDPPWPLKTVRVHTYDTFGERFSGVSAATIGQGEDFRIWCHLAIVLCVDDMWTFLTNSLVTNSDPQGYLLSLA
jgi:hypothetical protein